MSKVRKSDLVKDPEKHGYEVAVQEKNQLEHYSFKVDDDGKRHEMDEKKKTWTNMTWKERSKHVWANITVEPMLACYIMPSVLAGLATQNLHLEKACRVNLAYSTEVCDALTRRDTANYTVEEKMVQQLVAGMAGWKTAILCTLPCMLILFWGSWSDRHGRRKPCMLIPIIGEFITAIGLILCTYFDKVPMEVAGVTESLFPGLTGGWFTMLMGIFSYIGDVTTEEDRTLRIGIVNLFISLGVPIGMAFSGILLKKIGFYGIFSISAVLYLVAFFYGVFIVKEPAPKSEKEKKILSEKPLLVDFFDKKHVIETLRVAFKDGPRQRRLRVIMLIIVVMVVIGPMHGEMSVLYLFTRFRFNWSEVEFSFFSTYAMLTSLVGTVFSVGVFSHMMKIDDSLIGVMSSMSKIISSFVFAFAKTNFQIYMGPIAEILNGTSFIAMRSIASKLVNSDELGKVNSLFGVAESLMPLVYAPMYAAVYAATMNTLPGAFFLLGGALTMPAVIIFLWMYRVNQKDLKSKSLEEKASNAKKPSVDIISNNHNLTNDRKFSTISIKGGEQAAEITENGNGTLGKIESVSTISLNNNSRKSSNSFENPTFKIEGKEDEVDNSVLHHTMEIVRELPPLHIEHCKL